MPQQGQVSVKSPSAFLFWLIDFKKIILTYGTCINYNVLLLLFKLWLFKFVYVNYFKDSKAYIHLENIYFEKQI